MKLVDINIVFNPSKKNYWITGEKSDKFINIIKTKIIKDSDKDWHK